MEVNKAWEQSKDEIDENSRYGTWKADYFLSKPEGSGHFCHANEIRSADSYTDSSIVQQEPKQQLVNYNAIVADLHPMPSMHSGLHTCGMQLFLFA